jgi:hypothetical protein
LRRPVWGRADIEAERESRFVLREPQLSQLVREKKRFVSSRYPAFVEQHDAVRHRDK